MSTCCLYLFRVRGRITRIARVMPGAHTIPFLGMSMMNPDRAITSTVGKEIKNLPGIKSGCHNIFLGQTLYYFPAVLVSSSAEDKGEKGKKRRWGGGCGIAT